MLISYCLFERKVRTLSRGHDEHDHDDARYWYNIPAVIVSNVSFYKDCQMRFYVSTSAMQNNLFQVFVKFAKHNGQIQIVEVARPYENTEPSIWRMSPFWDKDVKTFVCRDIDSVPNSKEVRATLAFRDSDYLMQNIRSHPGHNGSTAKLLAGLCGFKTDLMKKGGFPKDFDEYYEMRHCNSWGCDQALLAKIFLREDICFDVEYADTPLTLGNTAVCDPIPGFKCGNINYLDYPMPSEDISNWADSMSTWAGEPLDVRKDRLQSLLDLNYEGAKLMKEVLHADKHLMEFFL